jgi:hypothetical protein
MRFCTKSRKYSIIAPGQPRARPIMLLLLPPKGGRDSAAPTVATVIE